MKSERINRPAIGKKRLAGGRILTLGLTDIDLTMEFQTVAAEGGILLEKLPGEFIEKDEITKRRIGFQLIQQFGLSGTGSSGYRDSRYHAAR